MNETAPTRLDFHDFFYSSGPYTYHDTYVGGEQFGGEEAVWLDGKAQYAMNYFGGGLRRIFCPIMRCCLSMGIYQEFV